MRWKKSRRRGVSAARIAALVLLLASAAVYVGWRQRPDPLPWHPIGAERVVTKAFDLADPAKLRAFALMQLGDEHRYRGRPFAEACALDDELPGEVYLLVRSYLGPHHFEAARTLVTLGNGGVARTEHADGTVALRRIGDGEADEFRRLLLDAGYPAMSVIAGDRDSGTLTLQSCIRGRYFGVIRWTPFADGRALPNDLAGRIEAFAADGAVEVPAR